jgi:hypothetical protein
MNHKELASDFGDATDQFAAQPVYFPNSGDRPNEVDTM